MDDQDVTLYMEKIQQGLKSDDDKDMIKYLIPVRDESSRVECINPKMVSEQDYANAKAALDKMTEKLDEFMTQLDKSKAEQK